MADLDSWRATVLAGVVGSLITLGIQWLKHWWCAPKLSLHFDEKIEGCSVPDVPYSAGEQPSGRRRYLRLRVDNVGLSTAKDVQVIVTKLQVRRPEGTTVFAGEVLDLVWSASNDSVKHDIPSRTPRFADVCYIDHANLAIAELCIPTGSNVGRLPRLDGPVGIAVSVAAANAKTVKTTLGISFDRTQGFTIGS